MSKRPLAAAIGITMCIVVLFAAAVFFIGRGGMGARGGWGSFAKNKVGVVEVDGEIISAMPIVFDLQYFREDDSIKAVLLRVDSPGGGVAASQEIYREIQKTAAVKPVICSMGSVAASGGYYVAAPCTAIMASPGTVTGSIGVVAVVPDMRELFQKIGLQMQYLTTGQYKAAGAPGRTLTEADKAMLQALIKSSYDQFIADVSASRDIQEDELRKIADGRVFTGQMAMELGLVDEMGNFNDAVEMAAELAGIDGEPELVWPEDQEPSLIEELVGATADAFVKRLGARLGRGAILQYSQPPTGM